MSDKPQDHDVIKHSGDEYEAMSWARWYHNVYVAMGVLETPPAVIPLPPVANRPPVAVDDAQIANENTSTLINNVLLNDTDLDNDTLIVLSANTTSAQGASVANNNNGTFIYTPPSGFTGFDSFNYVVSDSKGGTDTGTVNITVVTPSANNPPVAVDDSQTVGSGLSVVGNVLSNDTDLDGDTLFVLSADTVSAQGGNVSNNNNGTFDYTPPSGFNGADSFNYVVSDGQGGTDTGTVNITVLPPANNPPVAVDDTLTTGQDNTVTTTNVLLNDTDLDGDTLVVLSADTTSAQNGSVVNNNNGTFTYTPSSGFNGADSFNYVVSDGQGGTDTGTVNITVVSPDVAWQQNSIQPDPLNPRFFKYNNQPIFMLGATDDDQLQNWSVSGRNAHLDLLQTLGGNFLRNVLNTSVTDIINNEGVESDGYTLQPFVKIVGGADNGRYDLSLYNQVWFDRLAAFLAETESRSIIVSLTLWELWDFIEITTQKYHTNAWNPANNINYSAAQSGLPNTNTTVFPWQSAWTSLIRFGFTVPALDNRTIVLDLQNAFINKVMDTCLPYKNVIYNIVNERMNVSAPLEFSVYWNAYIKARAALVSKTIQVTDQHDPWTYAAHQTNISRADLDAYEVVQMGNTGGQTHYDSILSTRAQLAGSKPMFADKVYSDYEGTNLGPNEPIDKLFRFVFAGVAGARLHRPTNTVRSGDYQTHGLGLGFSFGGVFHGRNVLKAARMLDDEMDLVTCWPDPNFITAGRNINEAYILRSATQCALYFTGKDDASVTINLNFLPPGDYHQINMDVATGTWVTVPANLNGGFLVINNPAGSQTLTVIKSGAYVAPPSALSRIALYNFTEGSGTTIANSEPSTVGTNNLTINVSGGAATWDAVQGLSFSGGAKASSPAAAASIAQAIVTAQKFTIEFWIEPANNTQTGPARMMDFALMSGGASVGNNLLIGQIGDTYTARVRRTAADTWGILQTIVSPANQVNTGLQHVVVKVRSDGIGEMSVNGVPFGDVTGPAIDFSSWGIANTDMFIGNNPAEDRAFSGKFLRISIYDDYLTNAEISSLYNAGVSP